MCESRSLLGCDFLIASVGWVERQRNPPLSLTIQNDGVRSSIHPAFATIICNRFCAIKLMLWELAQSYSQSHLKNST